MTLQRVRFADNSDGTNAYTVDRNPIDVYLPTQDLALQKAHPVIDGANIYIKKYRDNQQYKLIWRGIRQDDFDTMISNLQSYVYDDFSANYMYIHLGTIGVYAGVFSTWTKIKVRALDIKYREGSDFLIDNMTLIFERAYD